jgi:hypothetical protein
VSAGSICFICPKQSWTNTCTYTMCITGIFNPTMCCMRRRAIVCSYAMSTWPIVRPNAQYGASAVTEPFVRSKWDQVGFNRIRIPFSTRGRSESESLVRYHDVFALVLLFLDNGRCLVRLHFTDCVKWAGGSSRCPIGCFTQTRPTHYPHTLATSDGWFNSSNY